MNSTNKNFVKKTISPFKTILYPTYQQEFHRNSTFLKQPKTTPFRVDPPDQQKTSDNIYYVPFGHVSKTRALYSAHQIKLFNDIDRTQTLSLLVFLISYITPTQGQGDKMNYVNFQLTPLFLVLNKWIPL